MSPRKRNTSKRQVHSERNLLVGRAGPVPLSAALEALPRQHSLATSAKLTLDPDGQAFIQAEIPRSANSADELATCHKLANEALDGAVAWLADPGSEGAAHATGGNGGGHEADVEAALARLSWRWHGTGDGEYAIDASTGRGAATRVKVTRSPDGTLRAATTQSLHIEGDARALATFALEANRRIRLARIGIEPTGPGGVRVHWDAVLSAALPADHLASCVEAVVHARALTRPSLAVLCDERIGRAYQHVREPLMGAPPPASTPARAPAESNAGRNEDEECRAIPIVHSGGSVRHPITVEH